MAAKPDGFSVARRQAASAGGSRWRRKWALLFAGLSLLGGCQNSKSRESIESERFLDQYAAGRGLTREQARDEMMAKMEDRDEKAVMTAVEDKGVVRR